MKTWYKIKPVDTFFFKGSTPMVMGENHTSQFIFPPNTGTLAGAVRTAVLKQQKIDFNDYCHNSFSNNEIISAIGKAGDNPPFEIIGPFFLKKDEVFIPAPYSWYIEKNDVLKKDAVSVYKAKPVNSSYVKTAKGKNLYIAKGREGELASIGGSWICIDDFYSKKKEAKVLNLHDFFINEPRTGIALERDRKVRESHLYAFNHIRLNLGVELVFGIRHKAQMPFLKEGILYIGGERRLGYYKTVDINFPETGGKEGLYMSLSAIPCKKVNANTIGAVGKIQYISGWDMKKGFHKPSCSFYPAGSVFTEKTDNNQILIKGE